MTNFTTSSSSDPVQAGPGFIFAVNDQVAGYDLWQSDGTPGGTERITDLVPGRNDFEWIRELGRAGNTLYFTAFSPSTYDELWALPVPSVAVTVTTDGADSNPGDGVCAATGGSCTLRAAIQTANAIAGFDRIALEAGTYTASTIIDGAQLDRVLHVQGVRVTLRDLTLRNGRASGAVGGCVLNDARSVLTLSNVVVTGCTSDQGGGGINNYGSLYAAGATFSNHTAPLGNGGALWNQAGVASLTNVTFSGNSAGIGGALFANGDTFLKRRHRHRQHGERRRGRHLPSRLQRPAGQRQFGHHRELRQPRRGRVLPSGLQHPGQAQQPLGGPAQLPGEQRHLRQSGRSQSGFRSPAGRGRGPDAHPHTGRRQHHARRGRCARLHRRGRSAHPRGPARQGSSAGSGLRPGGGGSGHDLRRLLAPGW